MKIRCLLGHDWNGCICKKCGKRKSMYEKGHHWVKSDYYCVLCAGWGYIGDGKSGEGTNTCPECHGIGSADWECKKCGTYYIHHIQHLLLLRT